MHYLNAVPPEKSKELGMADVHAAISQIRKVMLAFQRNNFFESNDRYDELYSYLEEFEDLFEKSIK